MALKNEQSKPWYLSKTLWLQVFAIIAIIVPKSAEFIQEYFAEAGIGWALLNMLLRLISKDKLEISSESTFKAILLPLLLVGMSACSLMKDDEEGGSAGGYPDPSRVCTEVTEENKEQLALDYGRSCKVGDFLSKGAPSCSSSLDKCMKKVY